MEVALTATLVERMRVTVIMMDNVMQITSVELTIAEAYLGLNLFMIAATVWRRIFALPGILVERIKVIVIQMLSVWMNLPVD